jgi:hypothetical protein
MKTIGNRPGVEGEKRDDRRLVEEVESLYHEVARLDHPGTELEQHGIEDHRQGEKGDGLHPIIGMDSDAETARRYSEGNLPGREELLERLNRIRRAYEMMLTCWPYASVDSSMADIKRT